MSRPEKPIDWDKVDKLLIAGCMGTEISPHFDMHVNTFYDRVQAKYGIGFTDYCAQKREQGDSLLKVKQFEKAMQGDNTLLVWLGKVRLKQKDESQVLQQGNITINVSKELGSGLKVSTATISDPVDTSAE